MAVQLEPAARAEPQLAAVGRLLVAAGLQEAAVTAVPEELAALGRRLAAMGLRRAAAALQLAVGPLPALQRAAAPPVLQPACARTLRWAPLWRKELSVT